jgi:hypothetical protein
MKVGFTGTRHGLTPAQGGALARTVRDTEGMTEFHQGCCVGADTEATGHVRHHLPGVVVHGRPGDLPQFTHSTAVAMSAVVHPARPNLARNQDIVDAADALFARPETFNERLKSGTWSTARRARKKGIPIVFVFPDGTVKREGAP